MTRLENAVFYYLAPIKYKNLTNNKNTETQLKIYSMFYWHNIAVKKIVWSLWKRAWVDLKNLTYILLKNPATILLDIYLKEMYKIVSIKIFIGMLKTSSFIIAQMWEQPKYSSAGEWVNHNTHLHVIVK